MRGSRGSSVGRGSSYRGRGPDIHHSPGHNPGRPASGATIYQGLHPVGVPDPAVTKLEDELARQTSGKMYEFASSIVEDPDKPGEKFQKMIKMPGRRDYGKEGRAIILLTNYLKLDTAYDGGKTPAKVLYKYTVSFDSDIAAAKKRRMMEYIVNKPLFQKTSCATDYANMIITTDPVDTKKAIQTKEIDDPQIPVTIPKHPDEKGQPPGFQADRIVPEEVLKRTQTKYKIELDGQTSLQHIMNYLRSSAPTAQYSEQAQVIQMLNIIVAKRPQELAVIAKVGGNKFYPFRKEGHQDHPALQGEDLGSSLHALRGYFASVRPTINRLLLNLNVTSGAFYDAGAFLDFTRKAGIKDEWQLEAFIHLLKVKVTYRDGSGKPIMTRVKTIYGFARPVPKDPKKKMKPGEVHIDVPEFGNATNVAFQFEDKTTSPSVLRKVTVQQYFKYAYNIGLRYPNERVLNVGTRTDPKYIPPELCEVLPGQPYRRILSNATQTERMLRFAARSPPENAESVFGSTARNLGLGVATFRLHDQDNSIKPFGLSAETKMLTVPGRVLRTPRITFADRAIDADPQRASWNLVGRKFARPGTHGNWRVLIINTNDGQAMEKEPRASRGGGPSMRKPEEIFNDLLGQLQQYGVKMGQRLPTRSIVLDEIKKATKRDSNDKLVVKEFEQAKSDGVKILLVILPTDDRWLYSRIKYHGDVAYGIHTVNAVGSKIQRPGGSGMFLGNLALKFNIKGGGVSHTIPGTLTKPLDSKTTTIFGIDVTHPSPGSQANAPSISAVVANVDEHLCQWPGSIRVQTGRQEMVESLKDMVKERLELWKVRNGGKLPNNIVLYRDGVSEGQYALVLEHELPCFEQAFEEMYGARNKWPKMSIIVVGKRHHTRFYPTAADHADGAGNRPSSNPVPGTIVDRGIAGRILAEFWLQAHQGLQGTARPAHYVVIKDDIGFGADALQTMTHKMCFLFNRATKAVSICPPAYYADLLCERGRAYLFTVLGENTSRTSTSDWSGGVHPNIRNSTWYI